MDNQPYKDRSRLLKAIGAVELLGGIAVGLLAPLEMYCFYLFSEGGRFSYEGFAFGSFMFANIASQIIGYYLIAAVLIPLGYGHLKMKRWVSVVSRSLMWAWLVIGAPMILVVFVVLLASKDLSLPLAVAALMVLLTSYLLLPVLLIRFYRGENVRRTLEARDAAPGRVEKIPVPILALGALYVFYIVMLHILILFNGLFPLFGTFCFGMQGIILLDISIACLALLAWGTLRQRRWAWWASVIFLGLFTFSMVFSLCSTGYAALLRGLNFPAKEMEMLDGLPIQGWHFAILLGVPLLSTWVLAVVSRRHFQPLK